MDLGSRLVSGLTLQESARAAGVAELPTDNAASGLSRDQQRFIAGQFCYILTWLLFFYYLLTILNADRFILDSLMNIILLMAGISGHSVAKAAKRGAEKIFDFVSPPSSA